MAERIISLVLSIIMAFFNALGLFAEPAEKFHVTTYLVANNVKSEESIHAEDFDIITDVILFGCATFDAKGQVHEDEQQISFVLDILRDAIGERDVKIYINLLGPGPLVSHDVWEETLTDLSAQHKLAFESGVLEDNIVALVNKYDFDGLYFDYEYPAELKDWLIFSKFLVGFDKKLGDKLLGLAVSTDVSLTPAAIRCVDRFEAMLYDIYDDIGRHSTFKTAAPLVLNFTFRGIPREKLDFGLPFYSRPTDRGAYWYGYNGCYDEIDENGYYYDASIDKTFWFNTQDVIKQKTEYAKKTGLGGVMIWHYSCDFASSNEASLLRAVGEVVNSN